MSSTGTVRPAHAEDAGEMARVHVQAWRQTFRGVMPDAVLDDPEFVPRRERFWAAALKDERYAANRAAVAEVDGEVVGIAMSGPSLGEGPATGRQLYILYVLAAFHGSGIGDDLLDAVLDPAQAASLWVADPAPPTEGARYLRAHAFYRKRGFEPDGAVKTEDGTREARMARPAADMREPNE